MPKIAVYSGTKWAYETKPTIHNLVGVSTYSLTVGMAVTMDFNHTYILYMLLKIIIQYN